MILGLLLSTAVASSVVSSGTTSAASSAASFGESKPLDLRLTSDVYTKESIVELNGKKFRKIEYRSQVVYMQLLTNESDAAKLQMFCSDSGAKAFNAGRTPLVSGAVQMTKRTSLFVSGLQQACVDHQGGSQLTLSPDILIGFLIKDGDDSRAILRNKRIMINPLSLGASFAADW